MLMIKLLRNKDQSVETKGVIILTDNNFTCATLELAWKNNEQQVSCIPEGVYQWVKVGASAHIPYNHISLLNVPNRKGICIHIANYAAGKKIDLLGCIGVGSGYADLNADGIDDLMNSKKTFEKLMSLLPDSGTIEIKTTDLTV